MESGPLSVRGARGLRNLGKRGPTVEQMAALEARLAAGYKGPNQVLADELGVGRETVAKARVRFEAEKMANGEGGREWARLIGLKVPDRVIAQRLRALVDSPNPVASAKGLEMVLDATSRRKSAPPPAPKVPVFVVSDGADLELD